MSATTTTEPPGGDEPPSDGPLLDLTDAGVKKFIKQAKTRGYVTMDELNKVLPSEEVTSEQIEDTLAMLSEMGVNVIESEEQAEEGEATDVAVREETAVVETTKEAAYDRTDDPVRMYLREMGSVELLSREGEIAIAKRIEAGRDTMIRGLCESPITFNAIIDWSNALNEGRMQLREIIDLEAMLSKGPTAEQLAQTEEGGEGGGEGEISEKVAGPSIKEEEEVADETEADRNEDEEDMIERRTQPQEAQEDDTNT